MWGVADLAERGERVEEEYDCVRVVVLKRNSVLPQLVIVVLDRNFKISASSV